MNSSQYSVDLKKLLDEHRYNEIIAYVDRLDLSRMDIYARIGVLSYKHAALFALGRYLDALNISYEQLRLAKSINDPNTELSVMQKQYITLENIGDIEGALRVIDDILSRIESEVSLRKTNILIDKANLLARVGKIDSAIDILEELKKNNNYYIKYQAFSNLGILYLYTLRNFDQAKSCFENAMNISYLFEDLVNDLTQNLNEAGSYLSKARDIARDFEENVIRALDIAFSNLSSAEELAKRCVLDMKKNARRNYAMYLIERKDLVQAIKILNELLSRADSDLEKADIYHELISLDNKNKEEYISKAREIYARYGLKEMEASLLLDVGNNESDLDKSIGYIKEAISIFSSINSKLNELNAKNMLALKLYYKKDYEEAKKLLVETLEHKEYPWIIVWGYIGLATIAREEGDKSSSLDYLKEAEKFIDAQRNELFLIDRLTYMNIYATVYREHSRLASDIDPVLSLNKSEQAKARLLLDAISTSKLVSPSDDPRFSMEEQLLEQLNKAILYKDPSAKKIYSDLNALWDELEENPDYKDYISIRKGRMKSYEEFKNDLEDNLIIDFLVTDNELLVYLVDNSSIEIVRIKKKKKEIEELSSRFFNLTKDIDLKVFEEASKILVEPLYDRIKKAKRIGFSPDLSLYYIPFHALFIDDRFLIEEKPIFYVPNLNFLSYSKKKTNGSGSLIVYGSPNDDLKFAMKEGEEVLRLLGSQTFSAGDKNSVLSMLEGKEILHFACHATYSQIENGLASFIVLPNGERIYARDILTKRLSAKLVFLSACETAKLGYTLGGDILGLLSSFLYAGAKSIIASLWKLNDYAAYLLVTDFYKNFLKIQNKAEALRNSILNAMKEFEHPYYWAPFELFGSWA